MVGRQADRRATRPGAAAPINASRDELMTPENRQTAWHGQPKAKANWLLIRACSRTSQSSPFTTRRLCRGERGLALRDHSLRVSFGRNLVFHRKADLERHLMLETLPLSTEPPVSTTSNQRTLRSFFDARA